MVEALPHAPTGVCVAWGIPFQIDQVILLKDGVVEVPLPPIKTRWLVCLHTSDTQPLETNASGFIPASPGHGRLGETAADYIICYADGSEARAKVQRRRQVGDFQRSWGENCFEAVAHHKPYPVRGAHEQLRPGWGWTQTRVAVGDEGEWVNWLWAWENPHPDKTITGLRFEPVKGSILLSAISSGEVVDHPLRWLPRCKARLVLPPGESFKPELDLHGRLQQIQLDLGQVISAAPRLAYPNQTWEDSYLNQMPEVVANEILIEYTAHPQACFHLPCCGLIPVADLDHHAANSPLVPVAPADQTVTVQVVEAISRKPVAVKLHLHGEWGEYLAPVDRHRIINPEWFEDYSVESTHGDWREPRRLHSSTYINGETRLKLPLGKVYVEVTKGFEIRPVRKVVVIQPDTQEIVIELEKLLDWRERGWVTADTHVHFLSPMSAMLEGAAEGVNVVNLLASQWGELMTNVGDFDGKNTWGSAETGGAGEYLVRVGSENRQHVLGHISLLGYNGRLIAPMTTGGPDESALGDPIESLLTEWARQCHQQGGVVVLPHFPNPRAEHAASIVNGEIDAVEMTSWENHYAGIDPYSLSDWYRYLNCGYLLPAVGGTDKMTALTAVGTVRTYAHLAADEPFTYDNWKTAIRRKETFVSYGPVLEFMVNGQPMGSRLHLPAGGGTVDVFWQVASVMLPMTRVELVVNGEIRESLAVDAQAASGHWAVKICQSAWLALLVRGHQPGLPEIIAAHSTPVMVEVENSALLAAADAVTILEQIEGALAYLDTVGTRASDVIYKRMRLELVAAQRNLHNRLHQAGHTH